MNRSLCASLYFVVASGLGFGCGPDLAESEGSGSAAGTESGTTTVGSAEVSSSANDTSTVGTGASTGEPFSCDRGEELIPGLCFERYDFEVPGPLVMQRAVGADVDGDGADALVVELELDGENTLTVWEFEEDVGPVLVQETVGWPEDFDNTTLLAADVDANGLDDVLRTVEDGVDFCFPDPQTFLLDCNTDPTVADHLHPVVVAHIFGLNQAPQLVSVSVLPEFGHQVYLISGVGIGHLEGGQSTPPCDKLIAVAVGDVDGNGEPDILHRSAVDCISVDDPWRDDVNVRLGDGTNGPPAGPAADAEIEPTLLLVADFDADGDDDVLVAASDGEAYRVLSWEDGGWAAPTMTFGPKGIDRLDRAHLRTDAALTSCTVALGCMWLLVPSTLPSRYPPSSAPC